MVNREEENIRQYVYELKRLYQDLFVASCIFIIALFAWMATGGGFWPLWLILAFGLQTLVKLISMGKVPFSDVNFWLRWVYFLTPEWQEKQVKKMMKESGKTNHSWNAEEHEQEIFNVRRENESPEKKPKKKSNAKDTQKLPKVKASSGPSTKKNSDE